MAKSGKERDRRAEGLEETYFRNQNGASFSKRGKGDLDKSARLDLQASSISHSYEKMRRRITPLRIASFVISIILILSCFTFSVSATAQDTSEEVTHQEMLADYERVSSSSNFKNSASSASSPDYQKTMRFFIENKGQFDTDVRFVAVTEFGKALFYDSKVQYLLERYEDGNLSGTDVVTLTFPDSAIIAPHGQGELSHYSNYFVGDPSTWVSGAKNYGSVLYQDLWPGIDLIYKFSEKGLKYEFVVAPFVPEDQVQVQVQGAKIKTDASSLTLATGFGSLTDGDLLVTQPCSSPLDASFTVLRDRFSFNIDGRDFAHKLLIDPIIYSTYIGGGSADFADGICVDAQGNSYITGGTNSTNFPTANPFRASNAGDYDAYILKFNAMGDTLVYSTYIGGNGEDSGESIAVDDSGNVYVAGYTHSTNFPTHSPYQATLGSEEDGFILKLNAAGTALLYSTYIGGSHSYYLTGVGIDQCYSIAVDAGGNAYVTGITNCYDFPLFNPYQATSKGGLHYLDAFILKLNPAGNALVYSTYMGGSGDDYGLDIAVDSGGSVYLSGHTMSNDFPLYLAFQSIYAGGPMWWDGDAYILKLNPAGNALVYSTYIGGNGGDSGTGITVDASGNAYVTGSTSSIDFYTVNAYQANIKGSSDAFILKLNAAGSNLLYSTYFGGSGGDSGSRIAVDVSGNAYVTGATNSNDFPVANPYETGNAGLTDVFFLKINTNGDPNPLTYSTYLGGADMDLCRDFAMDSFGTIHIVGDTLSPNFLLVDPYQGFYAGGPRDGFYTKIRVGKVNWIDDVDVTNSIEIESHPIIGSASDGTLYMASQFYPQTGYASVELRSSLDGGRTWDEPYKIEMWDSDVMLLDMYVSHSEGLVVLSACNIGFLTTTYPDVHTNFITTGDVCSFGSIVIDMNDVAHCVINDGNTFIYSYSTKPWTSWSTPIIIAGDDPGDLNIYSKPSLACDPTTGDLFMAYVLILPGPDYDIYVRKHTSSGWEAEPGNPLAYSQKREDNPSIAVFYGDQIVVAWELEYSYDDWDIYAAYSSDHGSSYSSLGVTVSTIKERYPSLNRYSGGFTMAYCTGNGIYSTAYNGYGQWAVPERVSDDIAQPGAWIQPSICGYYVYTVDTPMGPDPYFSTIVGWEERRIPSTFEIFYTTQRYARVAAAASKLTIDATQSIQFTSTVLVGSPFFRYFWDFGDGETSEEANPLHQYTFSAGFQATVYIADIWGKIAYDSISIQVNPIPIVYGISDPEVLDQYQTVWFTSMVEDGTPPYTYYWDFGDGYYDNQASTTHQYTVPGTYYPTVDVTDSVGITVIWESPAIQVNPLPIFNVRASPIVGLPPLEVEFTCTPENGTPPYTFEWDFADGGTSTEQNPVHQYMTPGVYNGTLILMDSVGTTNTQYIPTITVLGPLYVEPLVNRDQTDIGHAINFECIVAGGLPPYHFLWEFGDGGTSDLPDPSHTYMAAGDYLVRLTVYDSLDPNTIANQTLSIKINPLPEVVGRSERTELNLFQPLAFNCTVYNGTPPFQYLWDFGDGNTSDQPAAEHGYEIPGVYSISILIIDAVGEDAIHYLPPIQVNYLPVPVIHTYLTGDLVPATVWFECFVTWGTPPYNYTWDFGDGGQGFGNFTHHTFLVSGDYTVTVMVVDDAGSDALSECHVLIFDMISVQASISPTVAIVNDLIWFNCTVSGALPPYYYHWDFGDGTTSEERNATHAYSIPGIYEVILNYSDSNDPPYYSSWIGSVQVIPPPVPPSAPLNLAALAGNYFVNLSWSPPADDGGGPILSYNIYRGSEPPLAYLVKVPASTMYYNDTDVVNGLTYHYYVVAVNSAGEGDASGTAIATPKGLPSAPPDLQLTARDARVTLVWSLPLDDGGSQILGYRLYRGTSPGLESLLVQLGNVLTYSDAGLTNGQTYYYVISAVNTVGEGELSIEASATPIGLPGAPRNLMASHGDSFVKLSWEAPSGDGGSAITSYQVWRGTSSGMESFLADAGPGLWFNDTSVSNLVTYYYLVRAENAAGAGQNSSEVHATPHLMNTVPSSPRNLVATAGDAQVTLAWDEPISDGGASITGYKVYRGTTSGSEGLLITLGNVFGYNDASLTNGQTYYYKVSTVNGIGEGLLSAEASATPYQPLIVPSTPQDLSAEAGDGQVTLTWEAPSHPGSSPVTGYRIYRGTTSGNETPLVTLGNVLRYIDADLSNGQIYYYKVSALSSAGESVLTEVVVATPAPSSPEGGEYLTLVIAIVAVIALVGVAAALLYMRRKK